MINLNKYIKHEKIFHLSYAIYYIIYILSLIGVSVVAPTYLSSFTMIIKIYIAALLIWRFNPLKKGYSCTKYDKEIIFSSAILLLLTTTIGDYLLNIIPLPTYT